jgi:HEAT repeats
MKRRTLPVLILASLALAGAVLWRRGKAPDAMRGQNQSAYGRSPGPGRAGSPPPGTAPEQRQPSPESSGKLPPLLAAAIGQGPARDFRTRLAAISRLGFRLSLAEREALYAYLRDPSEDKWLRPGQSFALKNDILNALCDQEVPPAELTPFLVALWRDAAQPLVVRDYALQHFAPWYSKVKASQRAQILEELSVAAQATGQSYAGTALIALSRIQREHGTAAAPALSGHIQRLVEDTAGNPLARISAVQLAADLRLEQARNPIRQIALDDSQAETLRLAAIGALGNLGTPEELGGLREIAAGHDERLRMAAVASLRRLNATAD